MFETVTELDLFMTVICDDPSATFGLLYNNIFESVCDTNINDDDNIYVLFNVNVKLAFGTIALAKDIYPTIEFNVTVDVNVPTCTPSRLLVN